MSLKKKILSVITSAACMLSCTCIIGMTGVSDSVEAADLTGLTSEQITSQMKIGWNLGNSLDSTNTSLLVNSAPKKFVTSWGNPEPTQELFDAVHAGGFNTVRIPTTWFQHLIYNEETDMYEIEENWMNYVKKTVDYAYNQDMFVILNVHHEDWVNVAEFTDETYADASHKLKDIWTQVSEVFADYDQHLIFEGMNEPRQTGLGASVEWGTGDAYSRQYINNLNKVFIDTIRSQGSDENNERMLMIPGYCASSSAEAISAIEVPENSGNVALSVHAYLPYFFTMDTSSYSNHEFPGKSGWGEDYEYALDTFFSTLDGISDSKGVPVVIGEFSASDFENTSSREAWAKCYLSNAVEAGIPCVLWDNNVSYNGTGEAHGYIYRATNTWYPNSISVVKAMMDTVGVTDYTLPEYQEYVKPEFSWNNVSIGDNWVELYREENGNEIAAWKNFTISDWKNYVNEDYKLVIVHDSEAAPTIIFQGGWYTVSSDDETNNLAYFSYDNVIDTLTASGVVLADMDNMFVSATAQSATIYGVYAIPLAEEPTEETTNAPTEETTEPTEEPTDEERVILGDINEDGEVNISDTVLLKQALVNEVVLTDSQMVRADMNKDNVVNVFDCVWLKRLTTVLVE